MLWNLIPLAVMTLIVFYLKLAIISYILINIDIRPFETRYRPIYRPIYRSISRFKRPAATQASFCGFHANLQMSLLCLLCFSSIIKPQDKNLVKSSRTEFSVKEELESLPFTVQIEYSQHICRKCLGQLKKRRALIRNLSNLDALIFDNYSTKAAEIGLPTKRKRETISQSPEHSDSEKTIRSSTPLRTRQYKTTATLPVVQGISPVIKPVCSKAKVSVSVEWPSKTVVRELPDTLDSLGKMICRGTYKQIASAAWRNMRLRSELHALFLRDVDKECSAVCSSKYPSLLRGTSKKDISNISFDEVDRELKKKTPLLRAVLSIASIRTRKANEIGYSIMQPAVCMSIAIALKNRCPSMCALQLINSIILYHSGTLVSVFKCLLT